MSETLLEKILVAMAGPLTAAIVGTLIIGLFVAWIARRAQYRRERYELRRELIGEMTEAASALLYVTAYYRRSKQGTLGTEVRQEDAATILHEQYRKTRTMGSVLEARLQAYFDSDVARRHWHAAIDLLAVRYYNLLGQLNQAMRDSNAGPSHSGLTADQLEDHELVLTSYNEHIRMATDAVLREPMSRIKG